MFAIPSRGITAYSSKFQICGLFTYWMRSLPPQRYLSNRCARHISSLRHLYHLLFLFFFRVCHTRDPATSSMWELTPKIVTTHHPLKQPLTPRVPWPLKMYRGGGQDVLQSMHECNSSVLREKYQVGRERGFPGCACLVIKVLQSPLTVRNSCTAHRELSRPPLSHSTRTSYSRREV